MAYYFKLSKTEKQRQPHSLSPPTNMKNHDFKVLLLYIKALQLPVTFRFSHEWQSFATPTTIHSFDHTGLRLSNQALIETNELKAIILSFINRNQRQHYINAFSNWLFPNRSFFHQHTIMFEYLRTNHHKITSLSINEQELFPPLPYQSIHHVGNSTVFLTYEIDQAFYLEIVSLGDITSFKSTHI
ncbi:MAG TPA: hypothetical protein DCY20_03440 [Firmicutes bacterium]|nr:hypothetical protein [Bacillota bacterium]